MTTVSTGWIPPTRGGVAATVRTLARLARNAGPLTRWYAAALPPAPRGAALQVGGQLDGHFAPELRRWLAALWVEAPDPAGVELVMSPDYQLHRLHREGYLEGDCDDVAVLGAALALARGRAARFITLSFTRNRVPEHIYADVFEPGVGWLDLDILKPSGPLPAVTDRTVTFI